MLLLITEIAKAGIKQDVHSDLLHVTHLKLAGRAAKLASLPAEAPLLTYVQSVSLAVKEELNSRWLAIQKANTRVFNWRPQDLDLDSDAVLSLPNSKAYLLGRLSATTSGCKTAFQLSERGDRLSDDSAAPAFNLSTKYLLSSSHASDQCMGLFDFESWVEQHLKAWVAWQLLIPALGDVQLKELAESITTYGQHSRKVYNGDPERISASILVVMELWVALDQVAIGRHPLLKEYSPANSRGSL